MKSILVLIFAALSAPALAEATPVIYTGKLGMAPVQVVYDYLKERVADEYGVGEYRELSIKQRAASGEQFGQVAIELQQQGLLDDATKTQRYQLSLSLNEASKLWQIDGVKQDWQCRRGASKAWTQKPCK